IQPRRRCASERRSRTRCPTRYPRTFVVRDPCQLAASRLPLSTNIAAECAPRTRVRMKPSLDQRDAHHDVVTRRLRAAWLRLRGVESEIGYRFRDVGAAELLVELQSVAGRERDALGVHLEEAP